MKDKYENAWVLACILVVCLTAYLCVSIVCKTSLAQTAIKSGHITIKK